MRRSPPTSNRMFMESIFAGKDNVKFRLREFKRESVLLLRE